jgi:hypothetical protein
MGVLSHPHAHPLVRTAYIPVYYAASTLVATPVFDPHTPSHLRSIADSHIPDIHTFTEREKKRKKARGRGREGRGREGREREKGERGREVEGSRGDKSLRRE